MRIAKIFFNKGIFVGTFIELDAKQGYVFEYDPQYIGPSISLTMPIFQKAYEFNNFPAYFDGVLPEGSQLESLLKNEKLDRNDYFGQLLSVGKDLVGAFSVVEDKI